MNRFTRNDVEILSKETVFKGYFAIDRYRVRHRTFAGGWSGDVVREVFERGHAVAVLLYDPDLDHVVMIEQFRCGALAAGWHPWQLEIVAGIIEDGESLEEVARREVEEESGLTARKLMEIGHFILTSGGSSETCKVYCAVVDSTQAGGIHGVIEENEDIRVFTLPTDEAYAMVRDGHINNSVAVIALQWLMLERASLRRD